MHITLPPDTPSGAYSLHLLVFDDARYLHVRRLGIPMPSRDLNLGSIVVR